MKKTYRHYQMVNTGETATINGEKKPDIKVLLRYDETELTELPEDLDEPDTLFESGTIYQRETKCLMEYVSADDIGVLSCGFILFDSSLFPVVYEFLESDNRQMAVSDFVRNYVGKLIYLINQERGVLVGNPEINEDNVYLVLDEAYYNQYDNDDTPFTNRVIRSYEQQNKMEALTVDWYYQFSYREVSFNNNPNCYTICEDGSLHILGEKCYLDYYCYSYGHSYIGTIEFDASLLNPILKLLYNNDEKEKIRYFIYKNGGKLIKLRNVNRETIKEYGPQPKITYKPIDLPF